MAPLTFGRCAVCREGELWAMRVAESTQLIVIRNECESQWATPSDARSGEKTLKQELVAAIHDDVREAGWKEIE